MVSPNLLVRFLSWLFGADFPVDHNKVTYEDANDPIFGNSIED